MEYPSFSSSEMFRNTCIKVKTMYLSGEAKFKSRIRVLFAAMLIAGTGWVAVAAHYHLGVLELLPKLVRVAATQPLALWHQADTDFVAWRTASYWQGALLAAGNRDFRQQWESFSQGNPDLLLLDYSGPPLPPLDIPYVFERIDAPHLVALRDQEHLNSLVDGADNEYAAMLELSGWVGALFDHGTDSPPGGARVDRVAEVVAAGKNGAKFWCEIAARIMTHSATAMGWPSRLVTLSHNGYDWHHAVTEMWSNEHQKWFVVDTDFNVVYEVAGVPQSAFELVMRKRDGGGQDNLVIRQIAPAKQFFLERDGPDYFDSLRNLELFNYAHIDLRNDWATRKLPKGSPTGGDLATWRVGTNNLGPLLTVIPEVEDEARFNWPVNSVALTPQALRRSEQLLELSILAHTYSPYFLNFEYSLNGSPWIKNNNGKLLVPISSGVHNLRVRVVTQNSNTGPETFLKLQLK